MFFHYMFICDTYATGCTHPQLSLKFKPLLVFESLVSSDDTNNPHVLITTLNYNEHTCILLRTNLVQIELLAGRRYIYDVLSLVYIFQSSQLLICVNMYFKTIGTSRNHTSKTFRSNFLVREQFFTHFICLQTFCSLLFQPQFLLHYRMFCCTINIYRAKVHVFTVHISR
jgi:hypothetical protein